MKPLIRLLVPNEFAIAIFQAVVEFFGSIKKERNRRERA